MADKDYKAFIVEGEAREPQVIDNISKVFFKHGNLKIITLPAGENIYMLWKKLKADDFDTDIIEVLREVIRKSENNWKDYQEMIFRRCFFSLIMMYIRQIWENPHDIFICEQVLAGNNKVFIISAFPEFLVDYFGMKLWRTCVKHAKNQLDICNCK